MVVKKIIWWGIILNFIQLIICAVIWCNLKEPTILISYCAAWFSVFILHPIGVIIYIYFKPYKSIKINKIKQR